MNKQAFRYRNPFLQAAIFCSCLFVCGCENDPKVVNAWNENKVMVDEVKNVVSLFSQQGLMKARLTAPVMLRYQADTISTVFPKTLRVVFFDSLGKKESQVDALYGKYYESLNKVYLRDSVVVANVKGDTLRTPELWWDQNTHKFYTEKPVRVKTADKSTIYGSKGMEAEQDLSHWSIYLPTGPVGVPKEMVP